MRVSVGDALNGGFTSTPKELHTHGKLAGKPLQDAFRELTAIYHAEHAHSMPIRPPQISRDE